MMKMNPGDLRYLMLMLTGGSLIIATCGQVWVLYNGYNVFRRLLIRLSLNITQKGELSKQ